MLNIEKESGTPYILINCFGTLSKPDEEELSAICAEYKLEKRYINNGGNCSNSDGINPYAEIGPAEYVKLYTNATFVITNGYHGLMFSLIFNIPFVLLHRDKKEHWHKNEKRMAAILSDLE